MSTPEPVPRAAMDVQAAVAHSAATAELFATAPALLLELQTALGALAEAATGLTQRGRAPFRPDAEWATRLGELAYRVHLLADQTGVALDRETYAVADRVYEGARRRPAAPEHDWPVREG